MRYHVTLDIIEKHCLLFTLNIEILYITVFFSFQHDLGSNIFLKGDLIGIVTDVELGIFTKVSTYEKYIYSFEKGVYL